MTDIWRGSLSNVNSIGNCHGATQSGRQWSFPVIAFDVVSIVSNCNFLIAHSVACPCRLSLSKNHQSLSTIMLILTICHRIWSIIWHAFYAEIVCAFILTLPRIFTCKPPFWKTYLVYVFSVKCKDVNISLMFTEWLC